MAVPQLRFAHLPTPVETVPRLSDALGGARLLIKRDHQTGLAFGGNKTRKLEFLIAEAREQGAKTLISGGALQSNHCRQTAAVAARFGFECILVLSGDKSQRASGNLLVDRLFGAEIVYVADRKDRACILRETFERAMKDGKKPYLVPYGGSNATGALGYAFAMKELIDQKVSADWIVFGLDRLDLSGWDERIRKSKGDVSYLAGTKKRSDSVIQLIFHKRGARTDDARALF
ncbi:MAG: hypothetical protein DMF05_07765 [Verrucomicrobia bacterium]|nr:MAG: hypothetical protein DMF05_07765 [Verrucomicrobiota bacterium]